MLSKLLQNRKGGMYLYVVLILTLVVGAFLWYFMAVVVQSIQEATGSYYVEGNFPTAANFNTFSLANTFMNYFWTLFLVALVLGLAYYGWVYSQRKLAGGY